MKKMMRKDLQFTEDLDIDKMEYASIRKVVDYLLSIIDRTSEDAVMELGVGSGYYDSYHIDGTIHWSRPETDEEYVKRCEANHKRSVANKKAAKLKLEQKEAAERAMLVKLKMKYEG